jgi:hypothetical protein
MDGIGPHVCSQVHENRGHLVIPARNGALTPTAGSVRPRGEVHHLRGRRQRVIWFSFPSLTVAGCQLNRIAISARSSACRCVSLTHKPCGPQPQFCCSQPPIPSSVALSRSILRMGAHPRLEERESTGRQTTFRPIELPVMLMLTVIQAAPHCSCQNT